MEWNVDLVLWGQEGRVCVEYRRQGLSKGFLSKDCLLMAVDEQVYMSVGGMYTQKGRV